MASLDLKNHLHDDEEDANCASSTAAPVSNDEHQNDDEEEDVSIHIMMNMDMDMNDLNLNNLDNLDSSAISTTSSSELENLLVLSEEEQEQNHHHDVLLLQEKAQQQQESEGSTNSYVTDNNNDDDDNNENNNDEDNNNVQQQENEKWQFQLTRLAFVLLGIGVLLPWNAFVSAQGYFQLRLCQDNEDGDDDPHENGDNTSGGAGGGGGGGDFMLWFGFTYNMSGVLTLGILLLLHKRRRKQRQLQKQQLSNGQGSCIEETHRIQQDVEREDEDEEEEEDVGEENEIMMNLVQVEDMPLPTDNDDNGDENDNTTIIAADACSLYTTPIQNLDHHHTSLDIEDQEGGGEGEGGGGGILNLDSILSNALHIPEDEQHNRQHYNKQKKKKKESKKRRIKKKLGLNKGTKKTLSSTTTIATPSSLSSSKITPTASNTTNGTHSRHADNDDEEEKERILLQKLQKSQRKSIVLPLLTYLLIFTLTTSLILIPNLPTTTTKSSSKSSLLPSFQTITLTSISICGCAGAVASAGIVSFANIFPVEVGIQSFISGQALGGGIISILNFIFLVAGTREANLIHVDEFWEEHCSSDDDDGGGGSGSGGSDSALVVVRGENVEFSSSTAMTLSSCPPYHIDWGAFLYFMIGCILLVLCICLFEILDRQPLTNHYRKLANSSEKNKDKIHDLNQQTNSTSLTKQQRQEEGGTEGVEEERIDLNQNAMGSLEDMRRTVFFGDEGIWSSHWFQAEEEEEENDILGEDVINDGGVITTKQQQLMDPLLPSQNNHDHGFIGQQQQDEPPHNVSITTFVWRKIRWPAVSIYLTLFITLVVFPSWITKLESTHQCKDRRNRLSNDLFVPLCIVLFNVGDLAGRLCSSIVYDRLKSNTKSLKRLLVLASMGRVVFLPLFLLCKVSQQQDSHDNSNHDDSGILSSSLLLLSGQSPHLLKALFHTDYFSTSLLLLFAFSNGLVSTVGFMFAPQLVPSRDEVQKVASTILNFAVGFGLLCGSLFSFLYVSAGSG